MKKSISLMLVACSVLVLTGCGKEELKTEIMECNISTNDVINNFNTESNYKVYYTDDIVEKVELVEKVVSDDTDIISTFESTMNTTYQTMSDNYGGYTFEVKSNGNEVTSVVTMNYVEMDLEKFSSDQPTSKYMLNEDNNVSLEKLKEIYESMGGTCE